MAKFDDIAKTLSGTITQVQNVYKPLDYSYAPYIIPEDPEDARPQAGLPQDWDYKGRFGPDGQDLPSGAEGWTPIGDPYYGDGLTGWMKKLGHKFMDNSRPSASEEFSDARKKAVLMAQASERQDWGEMFRQGISATGDLLGALVGGKRDEETGKISQTIISVPARIIETGATALFDAMQAATNQTEAVMFGGVSAARELADQSNLAPLGDENRAEKITALAEKQFAPEEDDTIWDKRAKDAGKWMTGLLRDFPLNPSNLWDVVRAIEAPVDDKWSVVERNIAAGRIAYSGWIDTAVQEEYKRRFASGEDPYLLELELQNPIAELAGELIFDPLNVVSYFTKAGKAAKSAKLAHAQLVVDDASDLGQAIGKAVDAADEFSAAAHFDEIAAIKKANNERQAVEIIGLQDKSGLFARTASSKQARISSVVGNFIGPIATHVTRIVDGKVVFDPDKMHDIMKVVMGLASKDEAEIKVAVAAALNIDGVSPRLLMSDAAGMTGRVLQELVGDAEKANRLIDGIKGVKSTEEAVAFFGGLVEKSTASIFPTIAERAKAVKLARAGDISEDVLRLGNMPLSVGERIFLTAEKFKKASPTRSIDQFFANVYMGFSPGFYARNVINNYFTAVTDTGWRTVFQSEQAALETIESLAGLVPDYARQGIGAAGSLQDVKATAPFLKKSQQTEQAMSTKIVAQSMRETFEAMAPKAIADIEKNLGLSGDMSERVLSIWRANGYDTVATMNALTASISDEVYDVYRSFEWVDPEIRKGLTAMKQDLYPRITRELAEAKSSDEIGKIVQRYINDAEKFAKRAAEDGLGIPYSDLGDLGVDMGAFAQETTRLSKQSQAMNRVVEQKIQNFVMGAMTKARDMGVDTKNAYIGVTERINAGLVKQGLTPIDLTELDANKAFDVFTGFISSMQESWAQGAMYSKATNTAQFNAEIRGLTTVEAQKDWWDLYIKPFIGKDMPIFSSPQKELKNAWWELVYFPQSRQHFANVREVITDANVVLYNELTKINPNVFGTTELNLFNEAMGMADTAREVDNSIAVGQKIYQIGPIGKTNHNQLAQLAHLNGIPTISPKGKYINTFIDIVNKYMPEGALLSNGEIATKYKNMSDIPIEVANEAIASWAKEKGKIFSGLDAVSEGKWTVLDDIDPMPSILHPGSDETISNGHAWQQNFIGLRKDLRQLGKDAVKNYGRVETFTGSIEEMRAMKSGLRNALNEKLLEIRATAGSIAKETRDFALLDYSDRRNIDTVLAMIYPYHYWHSRTYANWMKRVASNPAIASRYANYRSALEEIHAGQPDWWKYNINTNELLGLDTGNPLYFNLEATLSPLNGMLGVDFNDPAKRTGLWTAVLSDLGKLGPSTWTPYSIATAMALGAQGEQEAAARWGGRLFPQTQTLTAAASVLEQGGNIAGFEFGGIGKTGILDFMLDHSNLDPNVSIFAGGIDPYTRNRIGRALSAMAEEGFILDGRMVSDEEFLEAARTQSGPLWQEAHKRAVNERAPGQLSSFFAGVGFKGRTQSDLQIDNFYQEYYRFINNQGNFSAEEVRRGYDSMRRKYPFMDTLLLAKKGGIERDRTYAYNTLGRIPPGNSEISKIAGIDQRLINKFYESKGYIGDWPEDERLHFMAGVLTLGSILEIPSDGTKQEWTEARNQMARLRDAMAERYGEDIHDQIDIFFSLDKQEKDAFLAGYPAVEQALDWKASQIANNPESLAAVYYGGIDQIEKYYKGLMYAEIDKELPNIGAMWDEYWTIPDRKERSKYWKSHPELKRYGEIKDAWNEKIVNGYTQLGSRLQEGAEIELRDTETPSIFAQDVQDFEPDVALNQIVVAASQIGGQPLVDEMLDYARTGRMSGVTEQAIRELSQEIGVSFSDIIRMLRE